MLCLKKTLGFDRIERTYAQCVESSLFLPFCIFLCLIRSKHLPKEIEYVMRGIYCHFSQSSARKKDKFQELVHAAEHTILSPGHTRWLLAETRVNQILEQNNALILYFQVESVENPTAANTLIKTMPSNEKTVPIFKLTSYAFKFLRKFNDLLNKTKKSEMRYCVVYLATDK